MKFKNPYIIAEISGNHCGSFEKAKKLIKCAKINGADAVKLQTYTADMMTIKSSKNYFKINDGLWKGYDLWDLYNKAHTPLSWHPKLFNYAKEIGITLFSTPFSEEAVDYLEKLNCPFYKVASFEMTDHSLVEKISRTKKPIIISTGMANLQEIEATVRIAKKNGAKNISPLHRKVLMKSFNTILYNHYRMEKDSAASKIQSHLREQYINYMNDINLFNLKTKK